MFLNKATSMHRAGCAASLLLNSELPARNERALQGKNMQGILNSFCERVKSQVSHQKINVLQQQNRKLLCRGTLPSKKKRKRH